MTWIMLSFLALALGAMPAVLFCANMRAYRPPQFFAADNRSPMISVLIPARDEETSIGSAVRSVLASEGVTVEVIVLDDHSQDATAAVVADIAADDPRVELQRAAPLPPGWCGKQHACAALAEAARFPRLVFLDADVRLAPDGLARAAAFLDASGADLVSGFPHQEAIGLLEQLVIPLIHFILLGFLPIRRMRAFRDPIYAAGCGQLTMARREAYERAGGHAAIRASLHDGIKLPRAFRSAGLATDVFDATDIATCRMYRSAGDFWKGLAKNAGEGLADPALILPATIVLLGGQIFPFAMLAMAPILPPSAVGLAGIGVLVAYFPRLLAALRFRQPLLGVLLHPLGVLAYLSIQWYALLRNTLGRPATWKGRTYFAPSPRETR
jgi:hypothetical protein